MTTKLNKIAIAEVLGTVAFRNGKKRIFALDKEATELLRGLEVGDPISMKIMDAWYKNWDLSNLRRAKEAIV